MSKPTAEALLQAMMEWRSRHPEGPMSGFTVLREIEDRALELSARTEGEAAKAELVSLADYLLALHDGKVGRGHELLRAKDLLRAYATTPQHPVADLVREMRELGERIKRTSMKLSPDV